MPTNLVYTYATEADIQALLGLDGSTSRVDDDGTGDQSVAEAAYMAKAIQWATDKCNFYLLSRYADVDLARSWVVNNWCVICAAKWLSSRRGNPIIASVSTAYEEAIEDMKAVHRGDFEVPGIGNRDNQWPLWSNVRVDVTYTLRKIRVERPISERTAQPGRGNIDRVADRTWEF